MSCVDGGVWWFDGVVWWGWWCTGAPVSQLQRLVVRVWRPHAGGSSITQRHPP
jgi:hypothetical protein